MAVAVSDLGPDAAYPCLFLSTYRTPRLGQPSLTPGKGERLGLIYGAERFTLGPSSGEPLPT